MVKTKLIKKQTATKRIMARRRSEKTNSNGWLKWLVISFLIVPIIGLCFRYFGKSQDDGDILKQAHQIVSQINNFSAHDKYYIRLVEICHPLAFEKTYVIGRRHTANSLNEKDYIKILFTEMQKRAEIDHETDVSNTLSNIILNLKE